MTGFRTDPLYRALSLLGLRARPMVTSVLLGVAGALSALGLAALAAWLITRAWQMPPILYLSVAVTGVRALGISRGVFRYLERLATHNLALRAMATARERLYRALAGGSPAYSVTLRRGELLARTADDVDELGNALILGLVPISVGAVTGLAAVIIMAVVSLPAAGVLAVALLVSGVVAPMIAARGSRRVIADGAEAADRSAEALTALLWHAPELAVAGRRGEVIGAVRQADADELRATDRGMRYQAAAAAATPLALGVSLLAACLIAIDLAGRLPGSLADVASGEGVTPMLFGVLILLPLSSFDTTAPLTEAGIQLERSRQAARRIMGLVDGARRGGVDTDHPDGYEPAVDPAPVTVHATGLDWGWPGTDDRAGVRLGPAGGIDFELPPGGRLLVTGASGTGKSTLLLTLAGLLEPQAGQVTVTGADGAAGDPRASCTYFAEEAHLFSTSVRENLLVAKGDATDDELVEALAEVGLDDWLTGLPEGLDTDLAGGTAAVSGGQRRRLLLARALLHPAPVVLLDEPSEHLDAPDARRLLNRILDGYLFGPDRTVVVVSHQGDLVDDPTIPRLALTPADRSS